MGLFQRLFGREKSKEQQAEMIEGLIENALGGDIPSSAQWTVQTNETDLAPFSVFGGAMGGAGAQPVDPLDRLAKLANLRDSGALTEQEFAEQKAKLLGESGSGGA